MASSQRRLKFTALLRGLGHGSHSHSLASQHYIFNQCRLHCFSLVVIPVPLVVVLSVYSTFILAARYLRVTRQRGNFNGAYV